MHVVDVPRAPVLAPIGAKTVNERLAFGVTATALETDSQLTLPAAIVDGAGLPAGAALSDGAEGLDFGWTPDFTQAGTHLVRFTVTDGVLSDSEDVEITVVNVNRAPIVEAVAAQVVEPETRASTVVTANDPDGDVLTCTATGLPEGATFDAATKTVDWTSGLEQSGAFEVVVSCSDGALAGETTLAYEVPKKAIQPAGVGVAGGCDCSGTGDASGFALVFAVLGLALARRRSSSTAGARGQERSPLPRPRGEVFEKANPLALDAG